MVPLALLLLAQAAPSPSVVRILVLDISAESVPQETTRAIRDEVAVELARAPALSILSTEDLRAAVNLEAESRALGCDTTSCLAEVGAALGARYVVHGSVARVGGALTVYLNLFDTEKSEAIAREAVDAATDAQLLPAVRAGAARIRDIIAPDAPTIDALLVGGAVGAGAGAILALVSGALAIAALGTVNDLDEPVDTRVEAQGLGLGASILAGAGLVAAAGGTALAVWRVVE